MKPLRFKLSALIVLVIVLLVSCKKDNLNDFPGIGDIKTSGTISVPSGMDQTGWRIRSGFNEGIISNSNYDIKLNENAVQLITVLDQDDNPVLMSIDVTRSQSSGNTISPETTAEALVFLNPFFCTSDLTEATELVQKINELSAFTRLVSTLTAELQDGSFSVTESNTDLISALNDVFKELIVSVQNSSLDKSGVAKSGTTYIPAPDFEVNGLKIVDVQQSNTDLSFKVANRAKRWISVYIDKSIDGKSFINATSPEDIIPSPSISIWNILSQGLQLPSEYSDQITTNTSGFQTVAVKCYGLGTYNLVNNLTDDELERALLPAACSAVFDLTIPVFEVMTGINFSMGAELRGRPNNDPFYRLVEKVLEDFGENLVFKAQIYKWYREGDIVKIVAEITKGVLTTCAKNPSIIAQILTDKVGREVAGSVVNSWLFPVRVINATITAANIGASLGSILATEAVTDFKFDNNTTTLPVQVKGRVKSFADSAPVSGASITSYDENGNMQQGALTDADGYYTLRSNTGYLKIRVVATGYKPTNQVMEIPQDIMNQNPAEFSAPMTWLSDYSGETGNVRGVVLDATNLNSIQGVRIQLRPGTNDPGREIFQEVISDSDGSFTFSDVPSGTYTAFYSKSGYIDDYLVLSVLGGETTTGFRMNLSPDIRTNSGYRIILTWDLYPEDLDSHIFTPPVDGSSYHVYFANKGDLLNPPYVNLDIDDVTSYGPETITIENTVSGQYYYSVYQYSADGSLTTSNATINLYGVNGFIRSWTVPSTGDGRWWNVFAINGETGVVTNINEISASAPVAYKGMAESDQKNKK